MRNLYRHRTLIMLVAMLAFVGAGAFALDAVAGPGCGSKSAADKSSCAATCSAKTTCAASSEKATEASTTTTAATSCAEECIAKYMAAGMTRADAEAKHAATCGAKANATPATAAAGCPMKGATTTTAAVKGCPLAAKAATEATVQNASATVAACPKTCGDKETCIAKCMKEKGMTRAEAEACWLKCQDAKTAGKTCPGHGMASAASTTEGSATVKTATPGDGGK
ncbi:MAG TPA: hypothetical protein VM118_08215 [Acidobacteriota bacterium]|nr:hypothetical protein [Acidobacteriota bacterium]